MNKLARTILPVVDVLATPLVLPAALILKVVRRVGVQRLPLCKRALLAMGVFPIRNHYYEPLIDTRSLRHPLDQPRNLRGIDWNVDGQLELLDSFHFSDELQGIPDSFHDELSFHFNNEAFESGDAEYWYQLIRSRKPERIVEIGSGNSTLMARRAIAKNHEDNPAYRCAHICIEPYEKPWLERSGVVVVRKRVEEVEPSLFADLGKGDILFIDSSHVIRPQGDVLFEYLELLPSLKRGVVVHVHDIFSPRDYLKEWVVDQVKFWNEQYLLEAFLTSNPEWRVLGALNYLHHDHYEKLKARSPYLTKRREPGSFYIEKIG